MLDSARMETFFRLSRIRPEEERHYGRVRVYNWPRPAPATRVTLLDGGADQRRCGRGPAARHQAGNRGRRQPGGDCRSPRADRTVARGNSSPAIRSRRVNRWRCSRKRMPTSSTSRSSPRCARTTRISRDSCPPTLGKALELGSGYGVLARTLAPRATRYACLDLDAQMFRTLRADLGQCGVVADVQQLPFAPASFDSVIANNVLEHLIDPLQGLREVRRVLVPGGRLYTLIPFDALNSGHELPAHDWKLDRRSLEAGVICRRFHGLAADRAQPLRARCPGRIPKLPWLRRHARCGRRGCEPKP